MMAKMVPAIEIRKLPPSIVGQLASILEYGDAWKRLMAIIPNHLSRDEYKCDITPDNLPKYNSEHFRIIEKGSTQQNRSCTEILFDEWGTSGRIRASLGHLKYLLTKAQLFRAADYVAELLGEDPPRRPEKGPAAPVLDDLSELDQNLNQNIEKAERYLDELNYPQHATDKIRRQPVEHVLEIPAIVITEENTAQVPMVVPNTKPEISDMIKFSRETVEEQQTDSETTNVSALPHFSVLLTEGADNTSLPAFSQILPVQDLSEGIIAETSYSGESTTESDLIPDISVLNQTQPDSQPDLIPDFDVLQMSDPNNANISLSRQNSESFSSLLPVLSLNTELPHFAYAELEAATSNFSMDKETGRFLGAGGFGSVFLAVGLLGKPVAVKKINPENSRIGIGSEKITELFCNEVEILYRYKHNNLVSLMGYSCDGPCYCLIYEYVPGGSLFDVLQKNTGFLSWKQRIHIALGTAKAVAYLHTAYDTPLIHRDIKSANILLDAQNNAKLCDFGIVKLLPDQSADLESGPCGTAAYMAPEYHSGEISIKLDTFSFGVVLLELLTSLPPLDYGREGADLVTYVENECDDSIEPLLDKTVGIWEENGLNFAEEIYNLTLKCLDNKEKRPVMVDVVQFLEDIKGKIMD